MVQAIGNQIASLWLFFTPKNSTKWNFYEAPGPGQELVYLSFKSVIF